MSFVYSLSDFRNVEASCFTFQSIVEVIVKYVLFCPEEGVDRWTTQVTQCMYEDLRVSLVEERSVFVSRLVEES